MANGVTFQLEQDKATKRTIRYADAEGKHNIYLSKEEVASLGNPTKIECTCSPLPD